jgi:hypothetical protein
MTTPFTIFLLSLIALIFLIVHKVMELHKGTSLVSTEMRDRGDEIIVENVIEKVKLILAKGWLAARRAILSARAATQRVTMDVLHTVQRTTVKLIDRMKHAGGGRGGSAGAKKKPAGSVSFFLKHVSDEAKRVTTESAVAAAEAKEGAVDGEKIEKI